ncbi:hypothetical protein DPMN_025025 [Dreissena polymorpha]|uniref:SRCR domain-containing protein n=1 Tax=Dreissena polymorpha TaxID=45954 RepID=A0A9D4RBA8_DREPO|nr:hypothetical protein DPMN_025025 [Dreissena polymorpha]
MLLNILSFKALAQGFTDSHYNTTYGNYSKPTTPYQVEKTQARLVGGSSNATGLLQLYYRGEWVTVYAPSSSYFTQNEAKVICNMLGYKHR